MPLPRSDGQPIRLVVSAFRQQNGGQHARQFQACDRSLMGVCTFSAQETNGV